MRAMWCIASILAANEAAKLATGVEPTPFLTPDYLWLWWVPFVGWLCAAAGVFWAK